MADDEHIDWGALLLCMALDAPPPVHTPDEYVPVGSPLDAHYNAVIDACNNGAAQHAAEARALHAERQAMYRDIINHAKQ